MLADLLALLDKPLVLLIVLAIGGVIGIALESALNALDREKRRAYWRGRNAGKPARAMAPAATQCQNFQIQGGQQRC
jgi:hypothetical protein